MHGLRFLLAAMLFSAGLPAAFAHAAEMPYSAVICQDMPEGTVSAEEVAGSPLYPDWDDGILHSLGYREQSTYYHGSRALVTIRTLESCWVSILHYSGDGNCYITLPAGRMTPRQQVSHTVQLPAGQQGITRVIFWGSRPERPVLEQLGRNQSDSLPQPGLLFQAWFPRTNRPQSGLPYEPNPFHAYENPPIFALTDIPMVRTQLTTDYVTYSKDCHVSYEGRRSIGTDDWGSHGQWVLSWGDPLVIEFYIPEHAVFTDAVLRLYLEQSSLYSDSDDDALDIRINGIQLHSTLRQGSISVHPKHVDYEMGQYMYKGLNVLELKTDAFSTRDWLLQIAEIWIR